MSPFSKKSALFFGAVIAFSCYLATPALADSTDPSGSLTPDVVSLENKFFDHPFPEDTMEVRVERLEKMVFGEVRTGSLSGRISALVATVPDPAPAAPVAAAPASAPVSNQNITPANSDDSQIANSSDYPRITQLEHEILGKTFVKEPVTQRLDQLERKAFGAPSTSDDLSARTDTLERYANNHFPSSNQTAYNSGEEESPATPSANPAVAQNFLHGHWAGELSPAASLTQQVTWLETRVFGRNYPDDALVTRVKRLDASVFQEGDNNSRHETVPEQVHSMIGAVELATPTPIASNVEQNETLQTPESQQNYTAPANGASYYTPGQQSYNQPGYTAGYQPINQYLPNQSPANNQYEANNQYQANNQYPATNQYPASNQYAATNQYQANNQYQVNNQYQANNQPQQSTQTTHKGSLLHGLAHALGTVGGMALRSGIMMGGYGMPGMYY